MNVCISVFCVYVHCICVCGLVCGAHVCVHMCGGGDVMVVSLAQSLYVLSSSSTLATFHQVFLPLPPTRPTSPASCDWVPGICWGAN